MYIIYINLMKKILPIFTTSIFALSASALTVEETTTFEGTASYDSKLTINSKVVYTIGNGTDKSSVSVTYGTYPLSNSGQIVVSKNSELSLTTTNGGDWSSAGTSGNIDVYGKLLISNTSTKSPFLPTISSGKTLNVYSGGTIEVSGVNQGGMDVNNGTLHLYNGSNVNISSGSIFIRGSNGTSKLIVDDGVNFTRKMKITLGSASISELDFSDAKTITLDNFTFKDRCISTIILPKTELIIIGMGNQGTFTGVEELILKDFRNDTIKINSSVFSLTEDSNGITQCFKINTSGNIKLTAYDSNGNKINLNQGDYWELTNDKYLNIVRVSVPEPAEWAMILGSLALGLAIYRRRK